MPLLSALSLSPERMLDAFGAFATVGLFLIVFAESGLLIGFFLPGDSLLFTAGVLASKGNLNIVVIAIGCFLAAFAGDQVGYTIGQRIGPALFRREDSRLFKQEYVQRTHAFFEKHGPKTIVLARFVPVVRTFAPVMAGVGSMRRRTFMLYNVVGAMVWGVGLTVAGYGLGEAFGSDIDKFLLPIIGVIVVLSAIPPFIEWRRHRRAKAAAPLSEADAAAEAEELEEILHEHPH
jgi:membrane-associated protein